MPTATPPARSRQSRLPADPRWNAGDIAAQWEADLDAGRIGNRKPAAPRVAANRARTAALFLRLAQARR